MALYKYKVSDKSGKISELLIEGDNQQDAARRIQRRGLIPLQFIGNSAGSGSGGGLFAKKLNVEEFTDRLVPLLEAEIPLEKALGLMEDGQEDTVMGQVVSDLRRGLHEGRKLSDLIKDRGREFPPLYSSVVEAGEEAGALPQVMAELRKFLSEAAELRGFIVSSSIYPAFIACSGIIMMLLVLGMIVPKFASALAGAGVKSGATDFLMALSGGVRDYWWMTLVVAALVVWWIVRVRDEKSQARALWDSWVLHIPIFKDMVVYSNIARLCRTMAILMRSGVHLLNTVSIAHRVVQNSVIRRSLEDISGELRQGQKISSALGKSKYIPHLMLKMVAVGEETGSVESMLERVAERYENDLKKIVKRLLNLFEPIVIILLGIGIGAVVLLMFMAIMDMQGAVN